MFVARVQDTAGTALDNLADQHRDQVALDLRRAGLLHGGGSSPCKPDSGDVSVDHTRHHQAAPGVAVVDPLFSQCGLGWIAHRRLVGALQGMSEQHNISHEGAVGSPSPRATTEVPALVILFNVVTTGLGGLYINTQSLAVTALAAGLVALLGLFVVVSRGHHR
jgi:hypothetical protein